MAWSPDSQWIAYMSRGARGFYQRQRRRPQRRGEAGGAQAVSFLANFNTDSWRGRRTARS